MCECVCVGLDECMRERERKRKKKGERQRDGCGAWYMLVLFERDKQNGSPIARLSPRETKR